MSQTEDTTMIKALKMIIVRSPAAAEEATRTIAAAKSHSPIIQTRYLNVLIRALGDQAATFTETERLILADAIEERSSM